MIDLHCHILPEVDDGAASLEEALAMARFCVRDGITHITATPHCHRHIHLLRSDILPHVAAFNEELARERVPLTILPGSEIRLTSTAEYRREFELFCHLGDGRTFTLLEFDWKEQLYPADAPELVRVAARPGHDADHRPSGAAELPVRRLGAAGPAGRRRRLACS